MLAFLLPILMAAGQEIDLSPEEVYEKVSPSVVAVRAMAPGGERSGTGIVLSKDGLILTSHAVCPPGAGEIRVWVRGPRRLDGELVEALPHLELALVRIRPETDLTPIEFGRSDTLRVGDACYTLGNAANSLILDDQPSFHAGIVSGFYRVEAGRGGSTYAGPVLETTAAVNVKMEGAPCLDARGRMIGLVTLNYSPQRFLGAAIPIDDLRPLIRRMEAAKTAEASLETGTAWLGLTLSGKGGEAVVEAVEPGSPADRAGLRAGDVLLEAAHAPIRAPEDLATILDGLDPGALLWLTVRAEGTVEIFKVALEKRP